MAAANSTDVQERWQALFDGRTLNGWQSAEFGGEGEVRVEDQTLVLDFGESLTGVTYQDDFPKTNYEIRLQAMRMAGIDFFCGLTFPYADSYCSLIIGGWAGAVVGLSNIDHHDASENATTRFMSFDDQRWYRIRLRVTPERIQAWIDDHQVVDQGTQGHQITIRPEVDLSRPLGIAAWQTRAALKDIEYRELSEANR